MAKVKVNLKKKPASNKPVDETEVEEAEDTETTAETTEEGDEEGDEETEGDDTATATADASANVESVSAAKEDQKDWVQFAATRDIQPPPTVGHFSVARELNIVRMAAGTTYKLPLHVAQTLVDAQAGHILSRIQ